MTDVDPRYVKLGAKALVDLWGVHNFDSQGVPTSRDDARAVLAAVLPVALADERRRTIEECIYEMHLHQCLRPDAEKALRALLTDEPSEGEA